MPVDVDGDLLAKNLRTPRRGAAGGPSGATAEHLKLLLESQVCTELFVEAATKLARGRVPPEIVPRHEVGTFDSSPKTGRVNPRYCCRRCVPQICRTHTGATVWSTSGVCHTPISVRLVHSGRY